MTETELRSQQQSGGPERPRRPRVLKGASILRGIDQSEIACTIRNMHDEGAELRVPAETAIPSEFLLYVPIDRIAYRCELRWRGNEGRGAVRGDRAQTALALRLTFTGID